MSSRNLRVAAVVLSIAAVLSPSLVAQEKPVDFTFAPPAAPAPRFDVDPTLVTMRQATNGTADPERPVAHAAWVVLALVANGSTLRVGTNRAEVRAQTKWLIERQDPEAGSFAVGTVPCSRSEQLLGALAMTEVWATSDRYRPYQRNAERSITATAAPLLSPKAPPPTVEEFVGAMLLARSAATASADAAAVEQIGQVLAHARSTMKGGKERRIDAALHLDELLQGKTHPPELTVAMTWPANLTADPLHTLVAALAVAVSPMHEKARVAQFETLAALVAARETKGEHAGTWAPAGGFDGLTTTAMHAITLALGNGKTPLFCAK